MMEEMSPLTLLYNKLSLNGSLDSSGLKAILFKIFIGKRVFLYYPKQCLNVKVHKQ